MYEYNVVVGVFKLQLAIYLHGDLKEKADLFKCIVYIELTLERITTSFLSGSPCLPQPELTPSANQNSKLAKEIVRHTFASTTVIIAHLKPIKFPLTQDIMMT